MLAFISESSRSEQCEILDNYNNNDNIDNNDKPTKMLAQAKMNTDTEKLLTTRESAKLLGVSLRTIQLWVESGVLPAWKTAGGHRRIPQTAIDAFLTAKQSALHPETITTELPAADLQRTKLLIVEDEHDLLELYKLNFEAWNLPVEVVTATNGFEGLIKVGEEKPAFVISDLVMPGMDGFRMIRTLRNRPEFNDMTIVVVSALSLEEIDDRGGLPDNVHILTKPVRYSVLEKLVRDKLTVPEPELATNN